MDTARHVRLFKNGRNQALRIPRDLELPGHEAILRKDGGRLVVVCVTDNVAEFKRVPALTVENWLG